MNNLAQIIYTSMVQALMELRANRLRTFLSLLGITIGIFCIIAVFTTLDSMKKQIETQISSLGSDVLYVGRRPWMEEFKWWEFLRRPAMSTRELDAVHREVNNVEYATLFYSDYNFKLKYNDMEAEGVAGFAVTADFEKVQNIDVAEGRYLSQSEIDGGSNAVVIGSEVYEALFPPNADAVGKAISLRGRKFTVAGVLTKAGQDAAGFNFDNAIIYPYYAAASMVDVTSRNSDPLLVLKIAPGADAEDVKLEVEGILRRVRKVRPGEDNNFAINQLSQITEKVNMMFATINTIGGVIGGFSLVVGAFGIANIMFVTVKERTKIIGLKKAIGARSGSILMEFLVEAVTLCITGGLIGIVLVLILSWILTYVAEFPITLSLENFSIGIGISALVGVLAGIIPARSAARLNPVVAIRSH